MKTAKLLARAGIAGALYAVLTIMLSPVSYGPVQFRVAEAFTVLPLVFPETAIGITVGCFISNIFGNGPLDMILGTLATLVSALLTAYVGKKIKTTRLKLLLGSIFPVVINAFIIPLTLLTVNDTYVAYFTNVLTVFLGQFVVILFLGPLVYFTAEKIKQRLK